MDILRIELPYPPSINHYYIRTEKGISIGAQGRRYRRDVALLLHKYRGYCGGERRLALTINVFPPDKRKRDIDNLAKCTLDSMQHARVFEDDNQVDMLTIIRRGVLKQGALYIWVSECCSSE